MGLIEMLRKCMELGNVPREQQTPQETNTERNERMLRQKMRVYPMRSLAKKTRTATASEG
jgi:hypothetical protein